MDISADAAPAGDSATTRESLAGMFAAELAAEREPEKKEEPAVEAREQVEAAAPEPADAADETVEETGTAEAEPDSEPDEATTAPAIDAPSGMSEADKANFAKLTPELRAWLSKTKADADAAFTRKSMEVAEVRKKTDAQLQALTGAMQQYDAILARYTDTQLQPPDPALRQSDPFAYEEQLASYVQAKHQQEVALQERQRNASAHAALVEQQRVEWLKSEVTRLQQIAPELADRGQKGEALRKSVAEYALKSGYTNEQLAAASATDMVTLMKAMRYDAAQSAKAAAKPAAAPPPKVSTPGPSKAAGGRPSNLAKAVQNLTQAGTRESLAAAYLAEIQSERR